MKLVIVGGVLAIGLLAPAAKAALLVSADFNAPTYSDGPLAPVAVAGDITTVGQDGWLNSSGGTTNPIQVSNTATNGIATILATGQDVRKLGAAGTIINSGSAYLAADITVTAAQSGDYFLHMGDGGTSNFYARVFVKTDTTTTPGTPGFQLALTTSSGGTPVYGAMLNLNQVYKILVRYDFVSGATNDTGAIFVNPASADGSTDPAYVAALTTGTDATSIASVNLRQGTAAGGPSVIVDNLSVTGNVVPEPASLAFVGLMGLGLLRRRRKN